MNLRPSRFAFICLSIISLSIKAQTLFEFDNSRTFAIQDGQKIYGFYDSEHPKQFTPSFSCKFFFTSSKKINNKYQLSTFYTESTFDRREKDSDINGMLIIKENEWILHTDEFHGGCASGAGENFIALADDPYPASFIVKRKSNALNIRLVTKKSFFFKRNKEHKFTPSTRYVTEGDVVIVLNKTEAFSYVQFSNPENSQLTKAWIKNSDLVNPFSD
ncbi:MAG TPA: hypothetical protein VIF82_11175 [Burkholderiaceae bacterium]|jgi:hypothetical protein